MAELPEQIKVSSQTKTRLLEIQDKGQHSSMDSAVRSVLDENEKLKIETELLKKKLSEAKDAIKSYHSDLKAAFVEINTKDRQIAKFEAKNTQES